MSDEEIKAPDAPAPDSPAPDAGFFNAEDVELARSRGWKPADEWKGDKTNLIEDPAKFNSVFEDRMPTILKENRSLRDQVGELQSAVESMADWRDRMESANEAARKRELESLQSQLNQAVEAGDKNLTHAIVERRDELKAAEPQPKPKPVDPSSDPAFKSWIESDDAKWFREADGKPTDPRVALGIQIGNQMHARGQTPQNMGEAYYRELSKQVNAQFEPKKQAMPAVADGGQSARPTEKKVDKWADLPKEVRDQPHVPHILKMYRKKAGGDEAKARDLYAKDWQQQQEAAS